MAIIKCPKCSQSISDKAEKCIHCGMMLHDCMSPVNSKSQDNAVLVDEAAFDDSIEQKEQIDYAEKFLAETPKLNDYLKKVRHAESVHKKLRFGLWLVWEIVFGLLIWLFNKDGESMTGFVVPVMGILAAFAVVLVLNAWFEYYPSYKYIITCSKWINDNGYDVSDYINSEYTAYAKLSDGDAMVRLFDFTSAWYYSKHEQALKNMRLHLIIRAAIGIACLLWLVLVMPFIVGSVVIGNGSTVLLVIGIVILVLLILAYLITFFVLTIPDCKLVSSTYNIVD